MDRTKPQRYEQRCSFVVMNARIEPHELRLKIVESDRVLLHEQTDPLRVERLTDSLLRDGMLRNPPVAARTSDGRYVVLDGATRTTALKNLGARHMLIQSVPYSSDDCRLEAWYHVLPDDAASRAQAFVNAHGGDMTECSVDEAVVALAERTALAAMTREDGSAVLLTSTDHSILRDLVGVYGGAGEIYRIVHDDLVQIVRRAEACPCVVMFPTFTPEEILRSAVEGDLLPAGITRHLISGRALNVNIPLVRLFTDEEREEKKQWLKAWLTQKILNKKVRYYHEPVFIFDD
jgi:L-serine kinase (ATP) / ParB family transcriptional regulator, heme-responsive regulator